MDYSKLTLGELLSSQDETIRRNAISILKVLQKDKYCVKCHVLLHNLNEIEYCNTCEPEFHKQIIKDRLSIA